MTGSATLKHIIDDGAPIRERSEGCSAGLVAETFKSARESLLHDRRDATGCLVLDVRMPAPGGPGSTGRWR